MYLQQKFAKIPRDAAAAVAAAECVAGNEDEENNAGSQNIINTYTVIIWHRKNHHCIQGRVPKMSINGFTL